MSPKKILVVFGATGNQGGSVIKSVLADPKTASEFKIRAITRDPSKPSAKALEAQGVECVAADINSKEQIKSAFEGAYAVFAVTNYWDKMDAELEKTQGKNVADMAMVGRSIEHAMLQHCLTFFFRKPKSSTSSGPPDTT